MTHTHIYKCKYIHWVDYITNKTKNINNKFNIMKLDNKYIKPCIK